MSSFELSRAIKGWFAGCVAGTTVLFIIGFGTTLTSQPGFTPGILVAGIFLAVVHFTFMAVITSAPSALFIWIVHKLELRYLVLFALFGATLGWSVEATFAPFLDQWHWKFALAGLAAGVAYWLIAERDAQRAAAS